MDLGKKILELRKKENISQEQLAEKLHVTRQTISKWELNETTSDIKQALLISKMFKVSLDELTENDINDLMLEKVNNTERLMSLVVKVFGIFFLIILVVDIITFIIFMLFK